MKQYNKIISSKKDFNNIFDNVILKNNILTFNGFYSKRLIIICLNCIARNEKILLFLDFSNLSKVTYLKCLREIKAFDIKKQI